MTEQEFWEHVDKAPGQCWTWQGNLDSHGYASCHFDGRKRQAYRVMWELVCGPIPDGLCVCHSCDNPKGVNPDHLWLGTRSQNTLDRVHKGRCSGPRGIEQHDAKLTPESVTALRKQYAKGGVTQRELARKYGMSQAAVARAILGQTWRHIEMPA